MMISRLSCATRLPSDAAWYCASAAADCATSAASDASLIRCASQYETLSSSKSCQKPMRPMPATLPPAVRCAPMRTTFFSIVITAAVVVACGNKNPKPVEPTDGSGDIGSGIGSADTGSATEPGPGSDTGSGAGSDTGAGSGSDTGTAMGSGAGSGSSAGSAAVPPEDT